MGNVLLEMQHLLPLLLWLSVHSAIAAASCTADLHCSLNGVCTGGHCVCDKPWSGAACETLNFLPVKFPQGYGMTPNVTTWGGGIIDGGDGKHHMYVSRMTNDCKLNAWTKNSRIDHAVSSKGPEGPYEFADVAVNTWAHNAAPIQLHDGTYAIVHIGTGEGGPNGGNNCTAPSSSEVLWTDGLTRGEPTTTGGSTIHISESLFGPWLPLQNSLGGCNNPAPWVHPNGTIFVGCGGAFKRAANIAGPYTTVASFPMGGGPVGHYEDPQIYTDKRGNFHCFYHVYRTDLPSTNCVNSTVSAHSFSKDGFQWTMSKTAPYGTQVELSTGETVTVATRERPKPFFDSKGVMTHLLNGVCGSSSCTDSKTGCVDCKYNHWDYTLIHPLDA